jgi:nucleotide sugar dehydrogenase
MKKICIIGAGVVGQAVGIALIHRGFEVIFVGRDKDVLISLKQKYKCETYLEKDVNYAKLLCDIYFLTVQTPTVNGAINLEYLMKATLKLAYQLKRTKKYFVVTIKSTVPPGTSHKIKRHISIHSNKKPKKDFGVCMNPEFLRQDRALEDALNPRLTLIGQLDKQSGDYLESVFKYFDAPIVRVSLQDAEMEKYVHNIYNACKIAFFNEMRVACNIFNAKAEVIFPLVAKSCEGIYNPIYGLKDKGPYSGACLPKDVNGMYWVLKKKSKSLTKILEAIINSNEEYKTIC